jgi:hypothetical protein
MSGSTMICTSRIAQAGPSQPGSSRSTGPTISPSVHSGHAAGHAAKAITPPTREAGGIGAQHFHRHGGRHEEDRNPAFVEAGGSGTGQRNRLGLFKTQRLGDPSTGCLPLGGQRLPGRRDIHLGVSRGPDRPLGATVPQSAPLQLGIHFGSFRYNWGGAVALLRRSNRAFQAFHGGIALGLHLRTRRLGGRGTASPAGHRCQHQAGKEPGTAIG